MSDNPKDILENVDDFEAALAETDASTIDDFSTEMNYDKFIVVSKKDLVNFCRIVSPLTKASVDDYGKSLLVRPHGTETVDLVYVNNPYICLYNVPNKSGKEVKPFMVSVATLQKLATSAFASLVFVENEGDINIALSGSLLYLETKPFKDSVFEFEKKSTDKTVDKELASYVFKSVGSILSCTERASEKVVVIKNKEAHFNTGLFTARVNSPFEEDTECVLFKQVADTIAALTDLSKVSLKYSFENKAVFDCDGSFYCEMPISGADKVNEFLSPVAKQILGFDANISIVNDTMLRLISIVTSLEYLSEIVTVSFTKDTMALEISTTNQSKTSKYEFPYVEGVPDETGTMKMSADVLKIFLKIAGIDCKYNFTTNGLGIQNNIGRFLLRKA